MYLKIPNRESVFLSLSLIIGMSIMYTGYFYGISDSSPNQSPGWIRTSLKFLSVTFFFAAFYSHFSVEGLLKNFLLKVPFIFIGFVTLLLAPLYGDLEMQAVNILFFLPLLAFNWEGDSSEIIFRRIWKVIILICVVQIILDPILKFNTGFSFQNLSLIGGLGNANVFGYWLLAAAISSRIILRNAFLYYFFIICTIFTGSAVIMALAAAVFIVPIYTSIKRPRVSHLFHFSLLIIAAFSLAAAFSPEALYFESLFRSTEHALKKLSGLFAVLFSDGQGGSQSVTERMDYFLEGMSLLAEYPLSLILGHPNGRAIFTGDGWWVALLVTHGLIITLAFALSNIFIILKGLKIRSPEMLVCSILIIITCVILLTNRILDYWPAAFLYFMSVSFICNHSAPYQNIRKNLA